MSRHYLSLVVVFLAWPALVHAVRPKAEQPAAQPDSPPQAQAQPDATPAPPPPYELKNRSAFTGPVAKARAPFWPIGWVHHDANAPLVQAAPAPVKIMLDDKAFKVSSILLGSGTDPSLAVINGRAYSEGEFLRMPRTPGVPTVRIRVLRISDGAVLLQHAEQNLLVPLRREEVAVHGEEKLLEDPDREPEPEPAPAPLGKVTSTGTIAPRAIPVPTSRVAPSLR